MNCMAACEVNVSESGRLFLLACQGGQCLEAQFWQMHNTRLVRDATNIEVGFLFPMSRSALNPKPLNPKP